MTGLATVVDSLSSQGKTQAINLAPSPAFRAVRAALSSRAQTRVREIHPLVILEAHERPSLSSIDSRAWVKNSQKILHVMGKVKKVGIWSEPVVSVVRGPGSVA